MFEIKFGVWSTSPKGEAKPTSKKIKIGWALLYQGRMRYGPYQSHKEAIRKSKQYLVSLQASIINNDMENLDQVLSMIIGKNVHSVYHSPSISRFIFMDRLKVNLWTQDTPSVYGYEPYFQGVVTAANKRSIILAGGKKLKLRKVTRATAMLTYV